MLINLNEDALRQIIREAVKENVTYKWANYDGLLIFIIFK